MEDIVFECKNCHKVLAVDADLQGRSVECVDCNSQMVVPTPELQFACTECGNSIGIPSDLSGKSCTCPECDAPLLVPAPDDKPHLKLKNAKNGAASVAEVHTRSQQCPVCHQHLPEQAVLCTGCGLDLRTGEAYNPSHLKARLKRRRTIIAGFSAAGVACLFLAGWAWHRMTPQRSKAGTPPGQVSAETQPGKAVARLIEKPGAVPPNQIQTVEETLVDGILKPVVNGLVFKTVSGATYEIIKSPSASSSRKESRVAPKVKILLDKGDFKAFFEGGDQMYTCRQIVPPSATKLDASELEWAEAERGPLRVGNKYGYSLKEGVVLELIAGGRYEVTALSGRSYISGSDRIVAVVSTNSLLYKVRIGEDIECLVRPLGLAAANDSATSSQIETVEETLVNGILEARTGGLVFKTVSGATYEVTDSTRVSALGKGRIAPRVTILRDKGIYEALFEGDNRIYACRQIVPPSSAKHCASELEWSEVERGKLLLGNKYGYSLKEGTLIELSTGGRYEITALTGHSYISAHENITAVISTNAYLYKAVIDNDTICLVNPVQTKSGMPISSSAPTSLEKCIAVIEAGKLRGTGFILSLDDKKYLVTNEHVVRGGSPLRIRLLSGETLTFKGFEICYDRDLVRMELENQSLEALSLSPVMPAVNQQVATFGNPQGMGVLKEGGGKVLALGPDRIEVDVELIEGMSGGPLLANGLVVGVSAYSVQFYDVKSYLNMFGNPFAVGLTLKDTKYFGVRIPVTEAGGWRTVSWAEYDQGARCVRDLWQCAEHLRDKVYRYIRDRDYKKKGDLNADECGKYTYLRTIPGTLKSIIETLNNIDKSASQTGSSKMSPIQLRDTRRDKFPRDEQANATAQERIKRCQTELNEELHSLVKNIDASIYAYRWPASGMKEEADKARKLISDLIEQIPPLGRRGSFFD